MLQLATRAVMQHDTYNRREPMVPNISFTNTKVRLKHMFIVQFDIVAKAVTNQKIGYPIKFCIVNFWSSILQTRKIN